MSGNTGRKGLLTLVSVGAFGTIALILYMNSLANANAASKIKARITAVEVELFEQTKLLSEDLLQEISRQVQQESASKIAVISRETKEEKKNRLFFLLGRKDELDNLRAHRVNYDEDTIRYEEDVIQPAQEILEVTWDATNKSGVPCKLDVGSSSCYPGLGNRFSRLKELKQKKAEAAKSKK